MQNHELTAARRDQGVYQDKRSYVTNDDHEYLFGADKARRRVEIFEFAQGRCCVCGEPAPLEGRYPGDPQKGDWCHIKPADKTFPARCDCLGDGETHGGAWAHHGCHMKVLHKSRTLRFGERTAQ